MACTDDEDDRRGIKLLFSTGRDGTLTVHKLSIGLEGLHMQLVHRVAVSDLSTVEQLWVDDEQQRLLVCGFRSKHFVLFDVLEDRSLMTINCGGTNRTWTFHPSDTWENGVLAWTKASQLCTQPKAVSSTQHIHAGGHGREIKAVAVAPRDAAVGRLIATGSEDTDIKLSRYQRAGSGAPHFRCLRTLRKHVTGIQHLAWSDDGRYLFSSGGFEELLVWKVQPVAVLEVGVFCNAVCPTESDIPDLRITNFSVRRRGVQKGGGDVDAFTITAARSDSTIRVYHFDTSGEWKKWVCVAAGSYLNCCITEILHINVGAKEFLVIAATDGHAAFYRSDLSSETTNTQALQWCLRTKLHQSTVHCACIEYLNQTDALILTGGDDNALSISRIQASAEPESKLSTSVLTIPRAHTAAITGIAAFRDAKRQNVVRVVTASLDQRLKVWEVVLELDKLGVDGVKVKRLRNIYTPVADVSSMTAFEDDRGQAVVVCGVGLGIWRLTG